MTDADQRMLEFEQLWWQNAGNKEAAIRERFGMSAVRYYQRLNHVLSQPEALAFDPILTNRLRRVRDARHSQRKPQP